MKHAKQHCNPASLTSDHLPKGSPSSQATWQGNLATLRQGDKLPSFPRSGNAFDTVAENRFTYGKAKAKEWDYNDALATVIPATSKAERKDKRESGSHVFKWTPKVATCCPVAKQTGGVTAISQSDRVTKRFYVTMTDPVTQEERSVPVTLITNEITVLCYGKNFVFSLTNRSKGTFHDSRDDKRHSVSFAKSELRRMLGATEGDAAYHALVTLPPKRPTTVQPGTGSSVARSQA